MNNPSTFPEKKVFLLGATGSIGHFSLKSLKKLQIPLYGFSFHHNIEKALVILSEFPSVKVVHCPKEEASKLQTIAPHLKIMSSQEAFVDFLASLENPCHFINGVAGPEGLWYTYNLLIHNQIVLLANKESIVLGSSFLLKEKRFPEQIIPIDSEHFSLFLLLSHLPDSWVSHIGLTASGGPFFHLNPKELENVTLKDALAHPVWDMGANISLGSATMANKGLEVLEAKELFGFDIENIKVRIHPQSLTHAFVFLHNGSWISHQYPPSMEVPITQALLYPQMPHIPFLEHEVFKSSQDFFIWDKIQFPMLSLAYEVGKKDLFSQIVYTLSNDIANQLFIQGRISFVQIADFVKFSLDVLHPVPIKSISQILELSKSLSSEIMSHVEKFLC